MKKVIFSALVLMLMLSSCGQREGVFVSGELMIWHKVTLEIVGPEVSENGLENPFLDYRLQAVFTNGEKEYVVPGYFAADGYASESGAASGGVWKVHFSPDMLGEWSYSISFRKGENLAISTDMEEGESLVADGYSGKIDIEESDKEGADFRAKGRLEYIGKRYLQHAGTGDYFLKAGADSPENYLGYADFDGTYYGGDNKRRAGEDVPNEGLHAYEPHVADWKEGDPIWQGSKGKGMIGSLNYLASKGMNSVYFLTMNIQGDGDDVWPYTRRNERYRFDCSKLDQWEVVFSHMERLGIMMHVVLQETENENVLDGGFLDVQRKLYLRELVARFGHHNALTWNLGEEHGPMEWVAYGQTAEETMKMSDYLKEIDPYDHYIVVHTHPNVWGREKYISSFLGCKSIDGLSIQAGNPFSSHTATLKWVKDSYEAGHPWVVCIDEIGQHWKGALPDAVDPAHDTIRKHVLWANLMAGGAGVEWYFGYSYPHADLNCEDWRSRDLLWEQTKIATDIFQEYLPFEEMESRNELVTDAYCLAKENEVYAVYYLGKEITKIDLREAEGNFSVRWFNPRTGMMSEADGVELIGGAFVSPGSPKGGEPGDDWLCLIERI